MIQCALNLRRFNVNLREILFALNVDRFNVNPRLFNVDSMLIYSMYTESHKIQCALNLRDILCALNLLNHLGRFNVH